MLPLRAVGRTDRARAGTKAANLGELANANFPVPDGFVLTADAFGRLLDQRPRQCWVSAFSEPATAYRTSRDQPAAAMAVLVQQLVQAEAAGVAVTANPITGDRTEVVISAVRALGERPAAILAAACSTPNRSSTSSETHRSSA